MKNVTLNLILSISLVLWIPVLVEAGTIQRISVDNNWEEKNNRGNDLVISENGRFVVFNSFDNLVKDDEKGYDVYVYDLLESKIERIVVDSDNDGKMNTVTNPPSISRDGRYVAFTSHYICNYPFSCNDLVIYDREDDVIVHKIEDIISGQISADGKYLIISSSRSLEGNVSDSYGRIYLYNIDSGTAKFISKGNIPAGLHSISGDGCFILFRTSEVQDGYTKYRFFAYDRITDTTIDIAIDNEGNELNSPQQPIISTNGRYVIFLANIGNWTDALFVHDLQTHVITQISDDNPGGGRYAISGNGNYIAFFEDTNRNKKPMFIYNQQTGEKLKSLMYMRSNEYPSMSGDGRYIVFKHVDSDLLEKDTNGHEIFVLYDMGTGSTITISGKINSPNNQPQANISLCIDNNCEANTDSTGNFILTREFRNGLYLITPQTSEPLKFTPKSQWLNVTDQPIENINFTATPYDPNPHIYVSTNAIQFSAKRPTIDVNIRMDFEGDEPIEKNYDVYVAVGAVGSSIESMLFHNKQTGFQTTLIPYATNQRITPTDGEWQTIFTYFFDKQVPPGDYFIHVGLMDTDNDELVAEDRVEVNYNPDPKTYYYPGMVGGVARTPIPKSELPGKPEHTVTTELETYLLEKNGDDSEEAKKMVKLGADTTLDLMIATLDHRGLKMFKKANGILNDISGAGIAYMDFSAAASTGQINNNQRDMLFGVYILGSLLEKASLYSVDPKDLADSIKRIFVASNEHKRTLTSGATNGGVSFPTKFIFEHLGFFSFMDDEHELKVKLQALIIYDDDLETPKKIMNENNLKDMYACQFNVQSKGVKLGVMLPDPGLYLVTAKDHNDFSVRQQTIIIDGADITVQFDYSESNTAEWDYDEVQKCSY